MYLDNKAIWYVTTLSVKLQEKFSNLFSFMLRDRFSQKQLCYGRAAFFFARRDGKSVFRGGIFNGKGERAEGIKIICLIPIVSALCAARFKETGAQGDAIRKIDNKLADERRRFKRNGEGGLFLVGDGEIIISNILRNANGFGAVAVDRGDDGRIRAELLL